MEVWEIEERRLDSALRKMECVDRDDFDKRRGIQETRRRLHAGNKECRDARLDRFKDQLGRIRNVNQMLDVASDAALPIELERVALVRAKNMAATIGSIRALLVTLGGVHRSVGELSDAEKMYSQALKLPGDDSFARVGLASVFLESFWRGETNRLDEAEEHCTLVLRRLPSDSAAQRVLGGVTRVIALRLEGR